MKAYKSVIKGLFMSFAFKQILLKFTLFSKFVNYYFAKKRRIFQNNQNILENKENQSQIAAITEGLIIS